MDMLIDVIVNELEQKNGFALATIISRNGSAPRMAGAQMIIRADGSIAGTIGGGLMEAQVMQLARSVIAERECKVMRINMTGKSAATGDMICGGTQEVLVEYLDPADSLLVEALGEYQKLVHARRQGWWITKIPNGRCSAADHLLVRDDGSAAGTLLTDSDLRVTGADEKEDGVSPTLTIGGHTFMLKDIKHPTLETAGKERWLIDPILFYGTVYIFGAGHVSQQLAKVTTLVGFRTVVIDDRAEFANVQRFPEADEVVVVPDYEHLFDQIHVDPESYMVIVTRGHLYDRKVLGQCLKSGAVYTGMIGSRRKIELVYQQLEKEGFSREQLAGVHAPIGLSISAETPEEIGVSIAAELIQVRNERSKSK